MGKAANERRKRIVQEVAERDERKRGKREGSKSGEAIKAVNRQNYENRMTQVGVQKREPKRKPDPTCCLDRNRPLPELFKACSDCPGSQKITEAGSDRGGVSVDSGGGQTEAG